MPNGKSDKHFVAHNLQRERWRGSKASASYDNDVAAINRGHKGKHPLCAQRLKVTSLKQPTTWIIPFVAPLRLDAKTCNAMPSLP
jgi:hypothetical protein